VMDDMIRGLDNAQAVRVLTTFARIRLRAGGVAETANKGDILNCRGKMPSLRRGGLHGSFNLPRELRMSVLCHLALGKIRVPFKTDTDYPVTLACSVNRCFFNAAGTDKLTP